MITNGEREEDLKFRMHMRNPGPRYMMLNTTVSYLKGADASELMAEYEIESTPALLLVDPEGKLVRQHTGSIPNPQELFEVTSPSRQTMVNSNEN